MMKDTIITARQKKRELFWMAGAFILANIINVYAVIVYGSPALELITSIFYVLTAAAAIYVFTYILRVIVRAAIRAVRITGKK